MWRHDLDATRESDGCGLHGRRYLLITCCRQPGILCCRSSICKQVRCVRHHMHDPAQSGHDTHPGCFHPSGLRSFIEGSPELREEWLQVYRYSTLAVFPWGIQRVPPQRIGLRELSHLQSAPASILFAGASVLRAEWRPEFLQSTHRSS